MTTAATATAPATLLAAFIGPRTRHDLLAMADTVVVFNYAGRATATARGAVLTLTGWESEGSGDEESFDIFGTVQEDCHCDRPCCSGSATLQGTCDWDAVGALYAGDTLVWEVDAARNGNYTDGGY